MIWAKSIICIVLFALIWIVPSFRAIATTYFNNCEVFLEKHKQKVLFTVLGIYLLVTLFLQWGHPVDGDEGQAWLIARDTRSLKEMYSLMGYEGSPALWHTLLRPFAINRLPFHIIYVINHLFITLAVIIWLWRAPFPLVVRILLPFTFMFLTEYSINARSYALSTCLLFTATVLYRDYHRKWVLWAIAFLLLANTNIHSTIICCGFVLFLLVSWFFSKNKRDIKPALLIMAGIVLAVLQVLPPQDLASDLSGVGLRGSAGMILTSVVTGTAALSPVIYLAVLIQVSVAIQNKKVLFALLPTQLVLFLFFLFVYMGAARHHYFLFLSIIMCLWIGDLGKRYRSAIWLSLFVILGMMITPSITIIVNRSRSQHNHKKEMTDYIKNEIRLDARDFMACHPDNVAAAILPKLDYKEFYMPDINRWGSYVTWNQQRRSGLFDAGTVRNVANLVGRHEGYKRYYYLTIRKLPSDSVSYYHIRLLKQATSEHLENAGNNWHTYYLYEIGKS